MADYTFFFHPMSRAQIARWAFHEAGASYDPVFVAWDHKPEALLAANPMGKLPTIIHHAERGDRVVTEAAAVCHYLAAASAPDLLPREDEAADYFRWLFFAAGPVEAAVTAHSFGWTPSQSQEGTVGFGSWERTIAALSDWFGAHDYVCGDRFTMADVYVGSQVDWGLAFGTMPHHDSLEAYAQRFRDRPAYKAAKQVDHALSERLQAGLPI